ncbi:MAG: sporulation protein YabP [Clostridia bacterium]|nr:sporulation protein YabP [Clostridia bacterium]
MNTEKARQTVLVHDCSIRSRAHADITGVREVLSFDEGSVVLVTNCGEMTLEGQELRVGTLDTERGIVAVDGKISALYYSDNTQKKRRGIFGRAAD